MLVHNCLPCTVELGRLPPEDLLPPLLSISSNAELPSSSDAKVTKVDTMSAAGSGVASGGSGGPWPPRLG